MNAQNAANLPILGTHIFLMALAATRHLAHTEGMIAIGVATQRLTPALNMSRIETLQMGILGVALSHF